MYRVQWVIRFPHYGRHKGGERSSSHAALPAQPNFTFSTFYFATKPPTASLHSFFILLLLPSCHHFLFHPLSEREGRSQGSRRHAGPGKFLHLCTVPTQDSGRYSANPRFGYIQSRKPSLSLSLVCSSVHAQQVGHNYVQSAVPCNRGYWREVYHDVNRVVRVHGVLEKSLRLVQSRNTAARPLSPSHQ